MSREASFPKNMCLHILRVVISFCRNETVVWATDCNTNRIKWLKTGKIVFHYFKTFPRKIFLTSVLFECGFPAKIDINIEKLLISNNSCVCMCYCFEFQNGCRRLWLRTSCKTNINLMLWYTRNGNTDTRLIKLFYFNNQTRVSG